MPNEPVPDWADSQLSNDLAVLRARGEGQDLEYMREFPQQVRELGKEIAAFASTNVGLILVGVGDDGDLIGLPDADTAAKRDSLIRRIEGICRGTVKPAVTPLVQFARESGRIVLAITVPKGPQPIYYCNSTPYVRHISESRPAEPHEVIERIGDFLGATLPSDDSNEYGDAIVGLVYSVAAVLIGSDELSERRVSPWLEQIRSNFGSAAEFARSAASGDAFVRTGDAKLIKNFAEASQRVAEYQLRLGSESWNEFKELVASADGFARTINDDLIASVSLTKDGVLKNLARVRAYAREVVDLAEKIPEASKTGTLQQTQHSISTIGENILHKLVFPLHHLPKDLRVNLRRAARSLHLLETRRIFGPRVESIEEVQESIEEAAVTILESAEAAEQFVRGGATQVLPT